jgi:hypothetical protein
MSAPAAPRHRRLCLILSVGCALWLVPARLAAEEVDLGLWVAWGGGAARQWTGEIRVETERGPAGRAETITDFRPAGMKPDEPGSMYLEGNVLHVAPRSPRTYDAVNLSLRAPPDAIVSIRLTPSDAPETAQPARIPLAQLIADAHNATLDDRGNRLLVRRSPGDKLRVSFSRDALVFAPGERFEFYVDPHQIETEAETALTYGVQLTPARGDKVLWKDEREQRAGAGGDPPEVGPFSLSLPQEEGVYEIHITLSKRRLPTRLAPSKTLYQRRLQLIVIDPQAAAPPMSAPWQMLDEIKPEPDRGQSSESATKSRLRESLAKLPHWKWPLPGTNEKKEPLGNGKCRRRIYRDREFVEILPDGWLAYPLAVRQTDMPHVVEVEYPSDLQQTLAISILEPNGPQVGVDSGLDVPQVSNSAAPRIERHRLVFWPRTKTPLLVLANHRDREPAVAGRIRVLAGPQQLPERPLAAAENPRLLAAYYSRPLLVESFSAGDTVDEVTGHNLKDWVTFHQAGSRLVQYLKYAGYNGAMLCVLHDGSTLYPSRLLQPTPKYDNGVFFGTAQDPVRKDVLEMLFRLFDRAGLRLVPALQFSTPLPELETLLRQRTQPALSGRTGPAGGRVRVTDGAPEGIELAVASGRTWRQQSPSERGAGPFYNPLDARVQQAVRRVVAELSERYRHHASFGGIALQLGADTFVQLPDAPWGADSVTVRHFAEDERLTVPGLDEGDRKLVAAHLAGDGQERWLRWRATKLAEFYQVLQDDLAGRASQARLYLAGPDMFASPEVRDALTPKLPERLDFRQALLRVGFDPALYRPQTATVLLRPQRLAPAPTNDAAVYLEVNRSPAMDQLFATGTAADQRSTDDVGRPVTGSVFFQEPQPLMLDGFDQANPFGRDKAQPWRLSQLSPSGWQNRQRFVHSLATLDSQAMFDGGWTPLFGQEEALGSFVDVYRRLPAGRFETVRRSGEETGAVPVVVRRLAGGNRTYLYVVNDSPWPVTVTLQLGGAGNYRVEPFGGRSLPAPAPQDDGYAWSLPLAPYDLVGASLSAANVPVSDWRVQFSRDVFAELRSGIDDVRRRATALRATALREPQALPPLPALTNPSFETPLQGDQLPGWEHARGEGITVELGEDKGQRGRHALRLRSRGPVAWVRSNPFSAPRTGRLSVSVWLRVDDPDVQPPLQVAIEGRLHGQTYYRPARVGAADGRTNPPPRPLSRQWDWFLVRIDDLPTSGVTDLRVAFDLMGPGSVWIDDVEVFDLWFDRTECNELLKTIALADLSLGKGAVMECRRILDGYWPEFLRRHVPAEPPQLVNSAPGEAASAPDASPPEKEEKEKPKATTSWLDRFLPRSSKLPKLVR